jgi:hypothetical protein
LPLIHTNSIGKKLAQPVGERLFGGETTALPRTEVRKDERLPGHDFLAFGPLVVAEVRTEWLDFLQGKSGKSGDLVIGTSGHRLFRKSRAQRGNPIADLVIE